MPYRVFISHASDDVWIARQTAGLIEATGAEVFLDSAHIDHGDDFEEVIVDAAERCDEMVVAAYAVVSIASVANGSRSGCSSAIGHASWA